MKTTPKTTTISKLGFDHPCRGTCSGWQQAYDKGRAEFGARLEVALNHIRLLENRLGSEVKKEVKP